MTKLLKIWDEMKTLTRITLIVGLFGSITTIVMALIYTHQLDFILKLVGII